MPYIHPATGVYPYSVAMLRRDYPQTSFPSQPTNALLAEFGVYPVTRVDRPDHDPVYQVVTEQPPALVDGVWTQQWEVRNKTPSELEMLKVDLVAHIAAKAQSRLDRWAQSRGYDGILSACTYAFSPSARFQAEGQRAVELRDQTWVRLYEILAEVEAGMRQPPISLEEIEADLPELTWAM